MDTENLAVAKHTQIPPKLLEDVAQSPEAFEPVARAMAVIHLDSLYRKMMDPNTPVATRIEFQKMINKVSRLEPEPKQASASGGAGFSVVINIPNMPGTQGTTIEAHAVETSITQTVDMLPSGDEN